MKKFENYIIEKPCDSNSDKLQKILIIESLAEDISVEGVLLTEKHNFQLKDFEESFSKTKK